MVTETQLSLFKTSTSSSSPRLKGARSSVSADEMLTQFGFSPDQRLMFLSRLSKEMIKQLCEEYTLRMPRAAKSFARGWRERERVKTKMIHPVSGLYRELCRAIDEVEGLVTDTLPERILDERTRPPTAAAAWLEVTRQKSEEAPAFSHPAVAEAVEFMGGWGKLGSWGTVRQARGQFVMAYKELAGV